MPCRGIAYQPRVQTLGIHPEKETRVLKERRITCVSRTSDLDHGLLYAVFLQNTPLLSDAVPRALPWAGMRCPFRAHGTITFPITRPYPHTGHRVPSGWCGPVGQMERWRFRFRIPTGASPSNVSAQFHWIQSTTTFPIPIPPPRFRSLCHQTTFPIPIPPNHVPDPMPCRGIAYQPRVQTLGIHPAKETRVLKERRITCVSRTSALGSRPRPQLSGYQAGLGPVKLIARRPSQRRPTQRRLGQRRPE